MQSFHQQKDASLAAWTLSLRIHLSRQASHRLDNPRGSPTYSMVLSIFSALVEEEFANSANSLTSFEFFSGSDLPSEKTKSFYAI